MKPQAAGMTAVAASGLAPRSVGCRTTAPETAEPCLLIATLTLADLHATERLARAIAPYLRAGDVLGLTGGLGSGKSAFARALIAERLRASGRDEEIPSPTYTLVQIYDLGDVELWHADLYRMERAEDHLELGLEEAVRSAICVVEWADRLDDPLLRRSLMLRLDFDEAAAGARRATVRANGSGWHWLPAVLRNAVDAEA